MREWIAGREAEEVAAVADHHVGFEWKPADQLRAKRRPTDAFANDKCSSRPDVHHIEAAELVRQGGGTKFPVPADVDASQENDECQR